MSPMPSLFVSHGSPMIMIEPGASHDFLTTLGSLIPRPRAILSITAHWISTEPKVSRDPSPQTMHDFGGFPEQLYELSYPAPGAPDVAEQVTNALRAQGIDVEIIEQRGLDHGTWVPMKLAYPDANIPVVQMSVQPQRSAQWHFKLGQALSELRKEDVLVLGSGSMTHNLSAYFTEQHDTAPTWVTEFVDWVYSATQDGRWEDLLNFEDLAPHAHQNHPTTEHFLPLFVALGAAAPNPVAQRLHNSIDQGVLAMDAYRFD